jgi:hypothetical protein
VFKTPASGQVSVVCVRSFCLICICGSSILGLLKRLQIRA